MLSNKKQSGSALIVSLVLLTSVTFLAMLSLQSSNTQIKIVNNYQIKEEVFTNSSRDLEKRIRKYRDTLDYREILAALSAKADGKALSVDAEIALNEKKFDSISANVEYLGGPPSLGYDLSLNSSTSIFLLLPVEIRANTIDKSKRFRSNQINGVNVAIVAAGR